MCRCCSAQLSCCCCGEPCSLCCGFLPSIRQSTGTRILYTIFLLFSTLVSCLMLSSDVQQSMIKVPLFNETCVTLQVGENCNRMIGYLAVYRIGFTMVVFHVVLMLFTVCVGDGNGFRAGLHNGYWGFKILALVGICIGSFYIPEDEIFSKVWMYVGMAGGSIFIILQLILLVDAAHTWHSKWYSRARLDSCVWHCAMYFCATVFMAACVGAAVLLYVYYTRYEECIENKLFISINGALCIILCVISVLPCIKRMNMNSGLLQGTVISLYVMYLTWSALLSEPDIEVKRNQTLDVTLLHQFETGSMFLDEARSDTFLASCGPVVTNQKWQMASGYTGAVLMLLIAVYARASKKAEHLGIQPGNVKYRDVCCCRRSRSDLIEQDRGGQPIINDEFERVTYSYAFFHFVYALGSLYIMMQLTTWFQPHGSDLKTFTKNWPSVWIKMSSSWVCVGVYVFTLFLPRCIPGRDFSFIDGVEGSYRPKRHRGTLV